MAQKEVLQKPPQELNEMILGGEDPLEKEMATHSSILGWRIPMDRGAWQATVHRVANSWTGLSKEAQHRKQHGKIKNGN